MTDIGLNLSLTMASPAAAFGRVVTPAWPVHHVFAYEARNAAFKYSNVQLIEDVGITILEPSLKLQDTLTTDFVFGSEGAWKQATNPITNKSEMTYTMGAVDASFDAQSSFSLGFDQPFYTYIGRGTTPIGATMDNQHVYTVLDVGTETLPSMSGSAVPIRLSFQLGRPAFLQYALPNPDGTDSWYWAPFGQNGIKGQNVPKSEDFFDGSRSIIVQWLPLPSLNMLLVDIAGGRERLILRLDNLAPSIVMNGVTYAYGASLSVVGGPVRLYGMNGRVSFGYYPMRFAKLGTVTSPTEQLPFVYQDDTAIVKFPQAAIPAGCSVTALVSTVDSSGLNVQYVASYTAPDSGDGFATTTPIAPEIFMNIPQTLASIVGGTPITFGLADICGWEEHTWLEKHEQEDPDGGIVGWTIRTEVGVKFWNGSGKWAATGGRHVAVQCARGLTIMDEYGHMVPLNPVTPMWLACTGWAGERTTLTRSDPHRIFDIVVEDRSWQLRRVSCGILPYFDEWCYMAAVRFILNHAGITNDWIDSDIFNGFCTCDYGPNPDGCPHYKLPVGTGANPKMDFSPTTKYFQCIMEIAGMVHEIMWFDQSGMFRRNPYYPGVYNAPYRGTFGQQDSSDPTDIGFCMGLYDKLELEIDTTDQRTVVQARGINPSTHQPYGALANVDDLIPGFTDEIHGFRDPLIMVSRLYDDPVAMNTMVEAALQKCMVPNALVNSGHMFLTTMSILDQYSVQEEGFVINGAINLSLEDFRARWSNNGTSIDMGSSMRGRWLLNL